MLVSENVSNFEPIDQSGISLFVIVGVVVLNTTQKLYSRRNVVGNMIGMIMQTFHVLIGVVNIPSQFVGGIQLKDINGMISLLDGSNSFYQRLKSCLILGNVVNDGGSKFHHLL